MMLIVFVLALALATWMFFDRRGVVKRISRWAPWSLGGTREVSNGIIIFLKWDAAFVAA